MHSTLPGARNGAQMWIQFDGGVAIFRQFPADAGLPAAACLRRRPAPQGAGNDAALSYIGPDGNQRAEACLGHAPVENESILATIFRRSFPLPHLPSGAPFWAPA